MKKPLIVLAVLAAVLLLSAGGCYSYANGVRTAGIQQEQAMSAQYKANQNELSTYTAKIYEMVDVANLKSAKMDTILTHAIQGRYGEDGFKANGAFFAAVTEAYPTLDLAVYDKVLVEVSAGREAFKNQQNKLADMKRAYDTWRHDGIVRSLIVAKYFPSPMLEVTVGAQRYAGREALERIDQMVVLESTQKAFATGTMETLDLKQR